MRTQGSAAELEDRRQLAIQRLHEGLSTELVAEFLGVHIGTVQKWKVVSVFMRTCLEKASEIEQG